MGRHTWVIAALFATGCAVDATGTTEQAIIGGTTAHTATYPTVVGLEQAQGNWFCAGVLIDKDWVLTTADCFYQSTFGTNFKVRFDSDNMNNGGGHTVAITDLHFEPGFNQTGWHNDMALIKLATSVTDRQPTPITRAVLPYNTSVTKLGYGATNNNGSGVGPLRQASAPNVDCAAAGDSSISSATVMCFDAATATSCDMDGGGPAFATVGGVLQVVGVDSGGTGAQCNQGYDLYTAVSGELAFIDTYVPKVVTVPPPDPTNPTDPTQPTAPTDPTNPTGNTPGGDPMSAGCNAGAGSTGSLVFVGLALALLSVRRARRQRA